MASVISPELLGKMFLSGAANLDKKKEWINELNVFPVPDGDTGTNMTLTIMSAVDEYRALENCTMKTVGKAMSSGSLRGARGNSGVILSQLFRGFYKDIQTKDVLTIQDLASACDRARVTAYKAVMKPKEGTILTVARGISEKASELAAEGQDMEMEDFLKQVIEYGEKVLEETPELLPVLKEAGVVDSGGAGLISVLQGAYSAFIGQPIRFADEEEEGAPSDKYLYDAEMKLVVLEPKSFAEADMKQYADEIAGKGQLIAATINGCNLEVHLLTDDPGAAVAKALGFGSLLSVSVDNRRPEEAVTAGEKRVAEAAPEEAEPAIDLPRQKYGFIAVSIGKGLDEIFKGLHVDQLISGGQTMNPSTDDMLKAIERINADNIFILPNNKNIILAAEQAGKLTADKNIIIIPTRSVPQGISALIGFNPEVEVDENKESMAEAIANVRTGQLTYAVRNTSIDGKTIHEGDFMGIDDNGIAAVGTDLNQTALELIAGMVDDDTEIISIYYGENVKAEDAEVFKEQVAERFPDVDLEMYEGGQPVYYYLLSAE